MNSWNKLKKGKPKTKSKNAFENLKSNFIFKKILGYKKR